MITMMTDPCPATPKAVTWAKRSPDNTPSIGKSMAEAILKAALREDRAAELIDCLFNDGSATVDPTGKLHLISGDQLRQMLEHVRTDHTSL